MKSLISVEDALGVIAAHALAPGEEQVTLSGAYGRRSSRDILAQVSAPPSDVSAMDGYAVRWSDVALSDARLRLVGEIPAGSAPPGPIGQGEAMRIFTGAPLPAGADHILIQEEAAREEDFVSAAVPQKLPQHARAAGRDFSAGAVLIAAGCMIGPAEIGLAAAGNVAHIFVRTRLKVAIITAGNELRTPGSVLAPGQIVDALTPALAALVQVWGGEVITAPIASDTIGSIAAAIAAARDADIIIPIGGASVGDYDLMKTAFLRAGAEIVFAGVAVRPGKPTWFARLGAQRVLGLPGNPASAYVCAHLFAKPLLSEVPLAPPLFEARLASPLAAEGGRESYLRAVCSANTDGLRVDLLPDQDSALLRPLQMANCLVRRLPGSPPAAAGTCVSCLPLTGRSGFCDLHAP